MSEYQYYEFQAIDRPLTREEMAELRTFSSRARISSTRFINEYQETAINTLKDLRELAALTAGEKTFSEKLEGFIELRRRKSAFMQHMRDAGLL